MSKAKLLRRQKGLAPSIWGGKHPSVLVNAGYDLENINPVVDFNNFPSIRDRLRKYLDNAKVDDIIVDLRSNLGDYLSTYKIGKNMYDSDGGVYLWSCPKFILTEMLKFVEHGGYAGLSLHEYLIQIFGQNGCNNTRDI